MKKIINLSILFCLFIVFANCFGSSLLKNSDIGISLIGKGIPIVRAVNEEFIGIKLISYMDIIKGKFMSENVFVELPEDFVELEKEKVNPEIVVEEVENNVSNTEIKSVTLDWKNEFKNNTKFKVDVEKLKSEELNFETTKKSVDVLIYHTHTTESYTKAQDENYEYSGVYRTLDKEHNVINVGRKVKELLERNNIGVYHNEEVYDYPSYNLSYSKAGKGITSLIKKYDNPSIVLDIHRDAIGDENKIFRPVINIDGKDVAQILLVVGSNEGGLSHSKWRENLKFALKIQQIANQKYPGLLRYVILRRERFNQHVAPGAIIVEMGATGNTMDEVLLASDLFVDVMMEVLD